MRRTATLHVISLFVLCLLAQFVVGVNADFDLSRVNYPDPVIGVTYNEPVRLLDSQTTLIHLDTFQNIGLEFTPNADGGFNDDYEIEPSAGQLGQGGYLLSVTARNNIGLSTPEPGTVTFLVTGLGIRLHTPESGYAPTSPYAVTIETFVLDQDESRIPFNAECKYFLGSPPSTIDFSHPNWKTMTRSVKSTDPDQYQGNQVATRHTVSSLQSSASTLSIICRRYKQATSSPVPNELWNAQFSIGTYTQGPAISVSATPELVANQNKPFSSIYVETDQPAYCEISRGSTGPIPFVSGPQAKDDYEEYTTAHSHIVRFDNDEGVNTNLIGDTESHEFIYTIQCWNPANLAQTKTQLVTIDFDIPLTIAVANPKPLTNANPLIANVSTNVGAACTVNGAAMSSPDGRWHTSTLTTQPYANYTLNFTCQGPNKEGSILFNFTTDRIPPENVAINASTLICDGNARAIISATENHALRQYVWRLLDDTGNLIANGTSQSGIVETTITQSGQFTWEAYAEDRAGNTAAAQPVDVVTSPGDSDACDPSPFIRYYEPPLGWWTNPFTPYIETKRPAECGWLYNIAGVDDNDPHIPALTTDYRIHALEQSFDDPSRQIHIRCEEENGTLRSRILTFGIHNTTPEILVAQADPNPVFDFLHKSTNITVRTSHDAVCRLTQTSPGSNETYFAGEDPLLYETYGMEHHIIEDYSHITNFDPITYEYVITCIDRASQSVTKQLPIKVDFLQDFTIEVLTPKKFTNDASADLLVRSQVEAACEFREPDSGASGQYFPMTLLSDGTHSAALSQTWQEGAHSIVVRCTSPSIGDASTVAQFTVDRSAPLIDLLGNTFVCLEATSAIRINATDNSSGINRTSLNITLANNTLIQTTTASDHYTIKGSDHEPGTITIDAITFDNANNPSQKTTHTIEVVLQSDPVCSMICGNGQLEGSEQCDDANILDGDGCSSTCQWEIPPNCGDGTLQVLEGEECDDANTQNSDGCNFACKIESPPNCGDGTLQASQGEQCDDGNIADGDGCDHACREELLCGDGLIDYLRGEQCEETPPLGATCTDFDSFIGGTLKCSSCLIDTSSCSAPAAVCGNGILEPGEECEGAQSASCSILGYGGGALSCTSECTFDLSQCTGLQVGVCGDGTINNGEACDDSTISASCADIGFGTGQIACTSSCNLDTNGCLVALQCNDGIIQPGEQCDGENFGNVRGCADIIASFTGQPTCSESTCLFDISACGGISYCGDGRIDYIDGEQCDPNVPIGVSCNDYGEFTGGDLSCGNCTILTNACTGGNTTPGTCGDGIIQAGEQCDGTNLGPSTSCTDYAPKTAGEITRCTDACTLDLSTCEARGCQHTCEADGMCSPACATDSACSPDPDCGASACSLSCSADNSCNSACALTTGCSPDPDCGASACSLSCGQDDVCNEECADIFECRTDPDCTQEEFGLIGLIIIILGLLTIGGASYYLYVAYDERKTRQAAQLRAAPPSQSARAVQSHLSPEERAKMMAALQKRRQEELEAFKQHSQQRSESRREVLKEFGPMDKNEKKSEQKKVVPAANELPPKVPGNQDDYVTLCEIKPSDKESSNKEETPKKEKKEDAFDALRDLIDETK